MDFLLEEKNMYTVLKRVLKKVEKKLTLGCDIFKTFQQR